MTNSDASLLARAWRALKIFDEAVSGSVEDAVLARLGDLESKMESLKAELAQKQR